ncbi:MAG: hypothetical protein A2Y17_01485 [Clostridiales bacterium GWF2_38_85]|nr:MAG: hypothetical protein A2Y17_01485 [Clostridiales bacterium GWF2_38_85]
MNNIKIYFEDDTENAEDLAINKGYRHDVYVKINNDIYNVRVYSLIRLQQDFITDITQLGYFAVEPNLILVNDVNRKEIIETINKIHKNFAYFKDIKPVEYILENKLKQIQ